MINQLILTCKTCFLEKQSDLFDKTLKKGTFIEFRSSCKMCRKSIRDNWILKNKEYYKNYYLNNKEKLKNQTSIHYQSNKDKYKMYCIKWRKANHHEYRIKANNYRKLKYKKDFNFKFKLLIRAAIGCALRRNNINTNSKSGFKHLGCTIPELKSHLESKFQEGMSWKNHGLYGWHIDHIIPLSSFNLEDLSQLNIACHYSNLQPLWAKDNLNKGAKI